MTPLEALQDLEKLHQQLMAAPPELACLAWFGICEMDRQRAAARNPTLAAMRGAVSDQLMRDIVNDQWRGVSAPASMATTPGARPEPPRGGTGWIDPAPLGPPPRVAIMDRMMDAQDARDRAELIVNAAMARRVADAARPTETKPTGTPVQPAKQSKASST